MINRRQIFEIVFQEANMNKENEDMKLSLDELDSVSGGTELRPEDLKAAAGAMEGTYIVKSGDTLHSIAG